MDNSALKEYQALYKSSIDDNDEFWKGKADIIEWFEPFKKVSDCSFESPVKVRWFLGGKLNVSYNCVDRHAKSNPDKIAIIWESDNPELSRAISYQELYSQVNLFAAALLKHGVKKGDRVTIYLPMIPEAAYAMLACARIGAIHSVVFAGFSAESLKNRMEDCESRIIITADEAIRGGKVTRLKDNVDSAIAGMKDVKSIVFRHSDSAIQMTEGRDFWYHDEVKSLEGSEVPPVAMDSEDALFILYTSGSTGKPKGVVHASGGYITYAAYTFREVFAYQDSEIFWCTADVGWITGHTYTLYGALANGATTLMFEGVPDYPDASRFWKVIDKHSVNIFYTAPTAIRALMRLGDEPLADTSRDSLRLLGSVGEPINPEAWQWYHDVVGKSKCEIVDTWWQTETGGHMITPIAGVTPLKAGSATLPFYGIEPVLVDDKGNVISEKEAEGHLYIKKSWPSQAVTVYKNHQRFEETYFSQLKGFYCTGDGARRDKDGYYWITGRVDDVINVSGHRFGTAEIENALIENQSVAESAVVGFPHELKGQGIFAYVILKKDIIPSEELKKGLINQVRKSIGAIATIDKLYFVEGLPKTRSGKIIRRILRKIAEGEFKEFGDTSSLTNPDIITSIVSEVTRTYA